MVKALAQRGFSLIELVLSMGLFATCFLFVVSVFPVSARSIELGRMRTLGLQMAQYHMEDVVANFQRGVYDTDSTRTTTLLVNNVPQSLTYAEHTTVSSLNTDAYDVQVVVSWTYQSQVHFIQLETILPRR